MKVTVSSKYQVVIPRSVRKQLNIRVGQKVHVSATPSGQVVFSTSTSVDDIIDRYRGAAAGAWGKDPTATIRHMRNTQWE